MAPSKKQQKTIDELGRRVAMCKEFMNDWLLFNQVLSAYPSPGANKADLENKFLKIKSKVAREHKVLQDALMSDYHIDANTMNIIAQSTSLESIYTQSEVAVKKLQAEWHRAFISINETLGGVEDKRARAEAGEKVFLGAAGQEAGGGGMSEQTKKTIIILVVVAIIAGIMIGVPQIRNMYVGAFNDLFNK